MVLLLQCFSLQPDWGYSLFFFSSESFSVCHWDFHQPYSYCQGSFPLVFASSFGGAENRKSGHGKKSRKRKRPDKESNRQYALLPWKSFFPVFISWKICRIQKWKQQVEKKSSFASWKRKEESRPFLYWKRNRRNGRKALPQRRVGESWKPSEKRRKKEGKRFGRNGRKEKRRFGIWSSWKSRKDFWNRKKKNGRPWKSATIFCKKQKPIWKWPRSVLPYNIRSLFWKLFRSIFRASAQSPYNSR